MLWQRLITAHQQNRLPHALLLTGQKGFAQRPFALALARELLAVDAKQQQLFAAASHPDLLLIEPEADKSTIAIDAIRHLGERFRQTVSHYRVAIIAPAEAMTIAASNALLKTLEEPNPNSLLLLISYQPQRVLPTITSRCQRLLFKPDNITQTQHWLRQYLPSDADPQALLRMADNVPLQALALAEQENQVTRRQLFKDFVALCYGQLNPHHMAEKWQDSELLLPALSQWLMDLWRLQLGIMLTDVDERYTKALGNLQGKLANAMIFAIVKQMHQLQTELAQHPGLNRIYQLQALLSRFGENDE